MVPDSLSSVCLFPTPSICSVVFMVPRLAQHTVSSTDFAKSKIPFRDLFYLKSIPLMGLTAFQSLSMHCQWGRIGFLRIPVLGGKQTAFLSVAIWPMNRYRTPPSWVHKVPFQTACLWGSDLTSTWPLFFLHFISPLGCTCWAMGKPCI